MGPRWWRRADALFHGNSSVSFAGTRKGVSKRSAANDSRLGLCLWRGRSDTGPGLPAKPDRRPSIFSKTAIDQAQIRNAGHEFIWSEDGTILNDFDVIVTSNCLAQFEAPLAVLEKHLASCKSLYIVLVPYNECPLHTQHRAQFRTESFLKSCKASPGFTRPLNFSTGRFGSRCSSYTGVRVIFKAVNRRDSMAFVVARLVAAQLADRQRAAATRKAALDAERQMEQK